MEGGETADSLETGSLEGTATAGDESAVILRRWFAEASADGDSDEGCS